jgi:hypothetical protein
MRPSLPANLLMRNQPACRNPTPRRGFLGDGSTVVPREDRADPRALPRPGPKVRPVPAPAQRPRTVTDPAEPEALASPGVPPERARALLTGRLCPVCRASLTGCQTRACSGRCRGALSRQRRAALQAAASGRRRAPGGSASSPATSDSCSPGDDLPVRPQRASCSRQLRARRPGRQTGLLHRPRHPGQRHL